MSMVIFTLFIPFFPLLSFSFLWMRLLPHINLTLGKRLSVPLPPPPSAKVPEVIKTKLAAVKDLVETQAFLTIHRKKVGLCTTCFFFYVKRSPIVHNSLFFSVTAVSPSLEALATTKAQQLSPSEFQTWAQGTKRGNWTQRTCSVLDCTPWTLASCPPCATPPSTRASGSLPALTGIKAEGEKVKGLWKLFISYLTTSISELKGTTGVHYRGQTHIPNDVGALKPGSVIVWPAFTSCFTNRDFAKRKIASRDHDSDRVRQRHQGILL